MNIDFTIAIIGNPNCGKTTLFNALTGAKQHVGNWPGVTVERKTGEYTCDGKIIQVVDLPGTYSLEASDDQVSLDEKIARDYVASREADLVINIVDASNIERNLYLTSQLIEMKVPMIVVLNMMDSAERKGIKIDVGLLSKKLGCPVIPVTAASLQGIENLKTVINRSAVDKPVPSAVVNYDPILEQAIDQLSRKVTGAAAQHHCDERWLAIRLLEDDTLAKQFAGSEWTNLAKKIQASVEQEIGDDIDIVAADARYDFVNKLTQDCVIKLTEVSRDVSDRIDRVVLNRFLGIPVFLFVMYLMFMFTINFGTAFVDFFDQLVAAFLVDGLSVLLTNWHWPEWLIVLLTDGVGGGIQVVATFIPIVGFLFLFLSVLEDSGYMARAAFVMDRFMRLIGLPGKSFVPMIVGFGCNVPAIMATRTLESHRDRILTNIMNPFMSCGARLPVYALFAAAFFPVGGQNMVFGLYLLGITVAVFTGLIMKKTLFQGESAPFIMELPTYHLPTIRGILIRTWDRLKTFLFNAGKVIVPMVLVLNFLNALGTDGSFGKENTNQSVLSEIGRAMVPAFKPMGIEEKNWPATVGIFTGLLAKEAVVGTLDALYSQLGQENTQPEAEFVLSEAVMASVMTIPDNLLGVLDSALDPLGLNIESANQDSDVSNRTFGEMQARFDGKVGAFAYLLFILLYAPCVAATAALYRETGLAWTIFVLSWTTGIAYMTATIFYQAATFSRHPQYSGFWIISLLGIFVMVILSFKLWGMKQKRLAPGEVTNDPV